MYHVAVDRAAMRQEILGPLFQRHVVSMSGTVDQRWLESFEAVQNDSDQFQRFQLDPQQGLVVHLPGERRSEKSWRGSSSGSR